MTILLIVLAVLAVGVLVILAVAAMRPNTFTVRRGTTIKAPPAAIFALINDFRAWPTWSPYENKDPAMQRRLSGAEAGSGAIYEWTGDKKVGQGRMEILESTPPSKIVIKLDFYKPFEAHNRATFTMAAQGDRTEVNWTMDGPALFVGKVMGLFVNLDRLVGADFEVGLANLKRATEK
jgi:uncharacterized protein YndB with AHSA1/START domain